MLYKGPPYSVHSIRITGVFLYNPLGPRPKEAWADPENFTYTGDIGKLIVSWKMSQSLFGALIC